LVIPGSSAQQRIDHDSIDGIISELLDEGWLVEGNTCWQHLVDDPFALIQHLGAESVSTKTAC
jgi:hypothetical protein